MLRYAATPEDAGDAELFALPMLLLRYAAAATLRCHIEEMLLLLTMLLRHDGCLLTFHDAPIFATLRRRRAAAYYAATIRRHLFLLPDAIARAPYDSFAPLLLMPPLRHFDYAYCHFMIDFDYASITPLMIFSSSSI